MWYQDGSHLQLSRCDEVFCTTSVGCFHHETPLSAQEVDMNKMHLIRGQFWSSEEYMPKHPSYLQRSSKLCHCSIRLSHFPVAFSACCGLFFISISGRFKLILAELALSELKNLATFKSFFF